MVEVLKKKSFLAMDLQLFAEEGDPGVEVAPAAEEQVENVEGAESQTGVDDQAAAEPEKQNNFEKAFAKRLAAEREKWDAERKTELEKYKDFETYKQAAEFLQEQAGVPDLLTLREEIELANLQKRAEKENVPTSVLKRIDELEEKAAKADQFEAERKQQEELQTFEASLKEFSEGKEIDGKPVDHMELWKYMHENGIAKPDVALKAMKADILEAKLETAKTDAINEYLESKKAPKIEGSQGSAAQQSAAPPASWDEAEKRATARMRAAREAQ